MTNRKKCIWCEKNFDTADNNLRHGEIDVAPIGTGEESMEETVACPHCNEINVISYMDDYDE